MAIIEDIFQPIYGKPAWQVQQGYGSFLTFEFGEPHLQIREPKQASESVSSKVRKHLAKRSVYLHGDWHLWIYLCDWNIFSNEELIAHSKSKRRVIGRATSELDGQVLTRVTVSKSYKTVFEFDLGGKLETMPYPEVGESPNNLWLLYEPSHCVFMLRSDGQCCHISEETNADEGNWQLLHIDIK
jgi:hypothetical protein